MEVFLQHQVVAIERGVEVGKFLQGRDTGLDEKREHGELHARLCVLLVHLLAEGFQVGDVGLVKLRDMRNHHPVAGEVGAGNLLDARQRLCFHFTELGEIDLGPREQIQPASTTSRRRSATRLGELGLHEGLDVLLQYPALGPAALHAAEIDAQLAGEVPHGRAGVRLRVRRLVDNGGG